MNVMVKKLKKYSFQPERFAWTARGVNLLVFVALLLPSVPVNSQIIAPLSRGWHRLPYVDGTLMDGPLGNSFFEGHNGHDVNGYPYKAWNDASLYKIAATADGVVISVVDSFNQCGSFPTGTANCNNTIWIDHLNGDFTAYDHVAFASSRVDSGDFVSAGDWIADEGDVGATGWGSDRGGLYRLKLGCNGTQDSTDYPKSPYCGVHLHLSVTEQFLASDTVLVHPRICGTPSHVLLLTTTRYNCVPCNSGDACVTDTTVSESWTDNLNVIVVDNALQTNGSVVIEHSVIGFQAGSTITLKPGFRALTGSYFRAEIGSCEGQ